MVRKCELLAPAGNMEKLKTAIHYGADAVYLGGKAFSLRARAGNFSDSEIPKAVTFAHSKGVKVYVTVNIFAHNRDLAKLKDYLVFLASAGVDGFIISDPGIIRIAREVTPSISIHLSTQANTTNSSSVLFWEELGIRRVNLARELGIDEIREIRKQSKIELEVFVHGALCISYSGRCMLSLYLTGRDANLGNCAHPCRYKYRLEESQRPGEYFPVEEDDRGVYIFNSKDLCLVRRLPEILDAGVDSIKIEGRMKGLYYIASVVRAYRQALNFLYENRQDVEGFRSLSVPEHIVQELHRLGSRGYTENFFSSPPDRSDMLYEGAKVDQSWIPACSVVQEVDGHSVRVKVLSIIRKDDVLEYMHRTLGQTPFKVTGLIDSNGNTVEQAIGGDEVIMNVEYVDSRAISWEEDGLIRRRPPKPRGE